MLRKSSLFPLSIFNGFLVFYIIILNICICYGQNENTEHKTNHSMSIKDIKISKEEAIEKAKIYLTEHEYNKYYVLSEPHKIKEDNNNWVIFFPQKGKSSDDSFDLRCVVNFTSIKVEIDKTHLSIMSSRHRDESLIGTVVVAECSVFGAKNSINGCILYLGGLRATRLETIIPKDDLKSFFDKCGTSVDQIEDYYGGKRITITGVLEKIEGSPMIVVHSPGQIEVTSPTSKAFPDFRSVKGTYGIGGFSGKF